MTRAATASPPSQTDEIDLIALLSVIWRGRLWIVAFAALGIAAAFIYATRIAVPLYPARTTIAFDARQQQVIGDIESIFGGGGMDPVGLNTEVQVLLSRSLIGRLVDAENLVSDPEYNRHLAPPSLMERARLTLTGAVRQMPPEDRMRDAVIDTVIGRLSITNIRQSLAFNIQIETTDPFKSARIVNTLAQIYIDNQIRQKLDDATRAIGFLSERTSELEAAVEALEQELARRLEGAEVIDSDLLQAQNLQLRDLRARAEEAQARLTQEQALRAAMDAAEDFTALIDVAAASDDVRFAGILQRFQSGRLSEAAAQDALAALGDDLSEDMRRRQAQLASLRRSADELTAQISAQSDELISLQQLERELAASRLLYETFLTRLQEASIQQGLESADSIVLSQAVPRGPSSPRVVVMMGLMALFGAMFGAAIALVREWRFAGFRTSEDLRLHAGMKALGSLPAMASRGRKAVLQSLKEKPTSVFSEAVRNLRTSILMVTPDAEPQVILVTSSVPGEGKTTLSLSLARYMGSLEGRRVLLLEADIRRQTLRAYVDADRDGGVKLLDVLLGRVALDRVDLHDPDLGVEVLMGSGGEFNAADLFESRRFTDLIGQLRERYDHIIIDSPPVLAVPDARVLSRHADLTVFAVRWGATTRTQVRQGLEMLESIGQTADGAVLTQVDRRKMKGYGYGSQYGYDGYASGYYATE
jgi:capsular exopolysaccharide synthesis family protein